MVSRLWKLNGFVKAHSRPKRSPSQAGVVEHALAGITLVIWDRISGMSRVVLSLSDDRWWIYQNTFKLEQDVFIKPGLQARNTKKKTKN